MAAFLAAATATTSSAWLVGYGTRKRAVAVALHTGRVACVYHSPSFLNPGPIVGSERAAPTARNFLLPYVTNGRRAVVSVPLYMPIGAVAGFAWLLRTQQARRRGFAIAPVRRLTPCPP